MREHHSGTITATDWFVCGTGVLKARESVCDIVLAATESRVEKTFVLDHILCGTGRDRSPCLASIIYTSNTVSFIICTAAVSVDNLSCWCFIIYFATILNASFIE